jgi:hypothetical protein
MAYTDIDKPSDYFNTVLWTGNGSGATISGVGFQPDWVWEKSRSATYNHNLIDSVRGANKVLESNNTETEATKDNTLMSFNSDGFVYGANAGWSNNGSTFVAWNWKAGTSFTNDASATGIGSIDSTGSVNTTSGFSIISYTGNGSANQSVAHGLGGATPKIILIKNRTTAGYWCMTNPRFVSVSDPNILYLQTTAAESDDTNINGTTAPSSTVFGVDDYGAVNTSGNAHIAYCFTPIKGYSAMGTYVGNGNADGTFVYTGFKPAWVMVKSTAAGQNWYIQDSTRSAINPVKNELAANLNDAEYTGYSPADFLSNGVKFRSATGGYNASATYIFMAFASNPLVTSTGVPATAR